jgi:large subunit ribosomal protein L30
MTVMALVRVRGRTHVRAQIEDAMKFLGLTHKNNCTLLIVDETTKGLLNKIKDYITWGEADAKTVAELLKKRGKVSGYKPLTDEYLKSNSEHKDINSLAEALASGKVSINSVKGLKRTFKLNPPRKGFERNGIKAQFNQGGVLGYRGEKISQLIGRMV